MSQSEERVQLSRRWKLFQLYSLQIALGCLSGLILLNFSYVEGVFKKIHLEALYAYFLASVIIIGVFAFMCSGGIGLFRLINAKRLLRIIEKEDNNDGV